MTNNLQVIDQRNDTKLLEVMQNSLYPGARTESVYLVLAACKAQNLDPMTKPFHIVPMWVKEAGSDRGGMRDVIMPGIDLYRIKAHRTGAFVGQSEVTFGPTVQTKLGGTDIAYPEWAQITVKRKMPTGDIAEFTVREYWLENYATAKRDSLAPNAMWRKRPFAQLAKCVEAQALRRAFPDSVGAQPTAEEMAGKSYEEYIEVDHATGEVTHSSDPKPKQDTELAAKLAAKAAGVGQPEQAHEASASEPEGSPESMPEQTEAADQEPGNIDLPELAAAIREDIAAIEGHDDANEVLDVIQAAPLTRDQKTALRREVTAAMKSLTGR